MKTLVAYLTSMNKKYIPGVIVVEGKHDVSKLSSIYDSCYVVTNGYEIPEKEIGFLKALSEDVQIIILTDNDEAGKAIREKLNTVKPNLVNIEITAPKNSKKKGVAECLKNDIEKALDKYVSNSKEETRFDLYSLGLLGADNSKELRNYISNKFNLGLVNNKTISKRLSLLNISNETLKKEISHANSK